MHSVSGYVNNTQYSVNIFKLCLKEIIFFQITPFDFCIFCISLEILLD